MSITKRERQAPRTIETPPVGDLFDVLVSDRLMSLMGGDSIIERAFEGAGRPMRVEEFVDGGDAVIRAELPGVDPDKDVTVSVEDGVLRICATREERAEEDLPDGYRSEFRYGTLVRSFRMPEGVSEDRVRATYKDGILEVRVPTPPAPKAEHPHKITIRRR
jgi:HSP20 family protein